MEQWVEMDQTPSKGKSPQQNMIVFSMKIDRSNWCGRKWTMSSCNKTFKQVFSFLSNLTSAFIYTSDSTSFRLTWNSKQVSELVEVVVRKCFVKAVFLEMSQNWQENTCARDYFLIKFIKKETLTQVSSCKFCDISKNTSFHRTPLVAASEVVKKICFKLFRILQIEYIKYKKQKNA